MGEDLIRLEWPHERVRPHQERDYGILAITALSKQRYLAVVSRETTTWDQWIEKEQLLREAKENGVVSSYSPEARSELLLAVLDRRGRVLDVGTSNRVADSPIGLAEVNSSLPLAMEMEPWCPYALLDTAARKLVCFDYELGFLREIQVPLDEITSARVTYDGKGYTVWITGRGYGELSDTSRRFRRPTTSELDSGNVPVSDPLVLGAKLRIGEGKQWEPIPLNPGELVDRLERIARGPDGEKLRLQKASLTITAFGDPGDDEPFWVLIEAVAAKKYDSRASFSGTRLYFRGRLDSAGLGKLQQLAFWLEQADGASSPSLDYDQEKGVLRLPNPVWLVKMRAYSVSRNEMVLYFSPVYGHTSFGGKRMGHFFNHVFLYFSDVSSPPDPFTMQDDQWLNELKASLLENRGLVVPLWLLGQVRKDEFLFRCFCAEHGKRQQESSYCIAVLGLEQD